MPLALLHRLAVPLVLSAALRVASGILLQSGMAAQAERISASISAG